MAALEVPVGTVIRDGIQMSDVGSVTPGAGDTVKLLSNDGNVLLRIVNSGAASWVDVVPTATLSGLSMADLRVTVPAGAEVWAGPWPPAVFNDASQNVTLEHGANGTLALSALQL